MKEDADSLEVEVEQLKKQLEAYEKLFQDVQRRLIDIKSSTPVLIYTSVLSYTFASAFGPEAYRNTEIREQVPDARVEIVSYEKIIAYWRRPKIEVAREANDDELIVKTCPMHVFEIEDTGELVAKYPRRCTMCRECQRVEGVKNYVNLGKEANHYEFTVESIGGRPAPVLVMEALQILNDECGKMRQAVDDAKPQ